MKRGIIFYLTGSLFLIISLAMIVLCFEVDEENVLPIASSSIPFLFTGIITIYAGFEARRYNRYVDGVFLSENLSSIDIQIDFREKSALPIFLTLFGTVSLAIVTAFLSFGGEDGAAYAAICISFTYGLIVTIFFLRKYLKMKRSKEGEAIIENEISNFGKYVAIFFAPLATGGLFLLIYLLIYRKRNKT